MTIYAVYTGTDLNSYVCELTFAADRGATLPTYRLNMAPPRKQTGTWQDLHPSTHWGSMTVILRGRIEFGVTAGAQRTVRGKAGDIFLFIDTEGPGHSTSNPGGGELFQVVNMRFADPIDGLWETFKKGFKGWPDNVKPPSAYVAGGPAAGQHTEPNPNSTWDKE